MERKLTHEEERNYFLNVIDFAFANISDADEADKSSYRQFVADELAKEDSQLWHDSPYSIIAARCSPADKWEALRGMALLNMSTAVGAILYREMEEEYGVLKSDIDVASIKSQIVALFSNDTSTPEN